MRESYQFLSLNVLQQLFSDFSFTEHKNREKPATEKIRPLCTARNSLPVDSRIPLSLASREPKSCSGILANAFHKIKPQMRKEVMEQPEPSAVTFKVEISPDQPLAEERQVTLSNNVFSRP